MTAVMRIPVDSTDAREQREAEAEQQAAEARDTEAKKIQAGVTSQLEAQARRDHAARCRRGWLGEDDHGRPVPCPVCRPWLLEVACWTCSTPPVACHLRNGVRRGPCCPHCNHQPHPDTERTAS